MKYKEWIKQGKPHWECKKCGGIIVTIPIDTNLICNSCKKKEQK